VGAPEASSSSNATTNSRNVIARIAWMRARIEPTQPTQEIREPSERTADQIRSVNWRAMA